MRLGPIAKVSFQGCKPILNPFAKMQGDRPIVIGDGNRL
jgi:small ligand-binding sensory domain FIST